MREASLPHLELPPRQDVSTSTFRGVTGCRTTVRRGSPATSIHYMRMSRPFFRLQTAIATRHVVACAVRCRNRRTRIFPGPARWMWRQATHYIRARTVLESWMADRAWDSACASPQAARDICSKCNPLQTDRFPALSHAERLQVVVRFCRRGMGLAATAHARWLREPDVVLWRRVVMAHVPTQDGRTSNRGFASMNQERQRQIASMGGKAVPTRSQFLAEPATGAEAGRKGGRASLAQSGVFSKSAAPAVAAVRAARAFQTRKQLFTDPELAAEAVARVDRPAMVAAMRMVRPKWPHQRSLSRARNRTGGLTARGLYITAVARAPLRGPRAPRLDAIPAKSSR